MITPALMAAATLAAASTGAARPADVAPPNSKRSYVARIVQSTSARAEPRADARRVSRVHTSAPWNGAPMQLLINRTARDADGRWWYRVLLAKKPNGSFGWIPADYAQARMNRWRVLVDLSSRRTTVFRDGRAMRSTRSVVGKAATPTPRGNFAVRELVRQPRSNGFYGTWILHLNANSQRLKSFDGGDGTVGIHGRGPAAMGDPLGSARSHGCVRVPNGFVGYLARNVVAGTPVRVRR